MTQERHSCEEHPWEGRAILHVDLDAFFAAVEQLDHPEWRGKPVIVGGDPSRRGVVSTCSYEARAFGVRSAMSSARAAQLCPDAIWTRGSFERYHEISSAVRAIFADESPRMQPVSIDEAYLDVTPGRYSTEHPVAVARRIRARVAELGVTCSVGVSASKSVAKIASDHDKPDGLTVVCPGEEAAFLAPLPVRAMPGIGPRTAERLGELGLRTLGDVAALDDTTARQVLGSHGTDLVARARGLDGREVHDNAGVKSVSNERTFATDVRTPDGGRRRALRARRQGRPAVEAQGAGRPNRDRQAALLGLHDQDRAPHRCRPRSTTNASSCPSPRDLLRSAWSAGIGLRLLGIGVSGFDDKVVQLDLLASSCGRRHGRCAPSPLARGSSRGLDAVRAGSGTVPSRQVASSHLDAPDPDPQDEGQPGVPE